jgi:hypothetical protein
VALNLSGNRWRVGVVEGNDRRRTLPMKQLRMILPIALLTVTAVACNSEEAAITTTTADASQLTTTTTADDATSTTDDTGSTGTTAAPADEIESHEIISRLSTEDGETLYILVPPGDYSDVSIENFLGDLLEDETAVAGVEVFDDRVALDAALKDEADRTADELQAIEDHHLVSLIDGTEVQFQGPMSEFDDFIIGS